MSKSKIAITASKPTPALQTPLKLNAKEFSIAIAKGVGHFFTGKFDDLADDGIDAMTSIGLEGATPEASAFELLASSLSAAITSLLRDSDISVDNPERLNSLTKHLEREIADFEVDSNFFNSPSNSGIIKSVIPAIAIWLEHLGVSAKIASTISSRLGGYFPLALHEQWLKNARNYENITQTLNTPFSDAANSIYAWNVYVAKLQMKLDESIFNEPFGLRQIYVPLNAYYEDSKSKVDLVSSDKKQVVVSLQNELDAWLNSKNKDDAFRAISGGPGSGKSSFSKIYAVHAVETTSINVLLVPLHFIDPTRDFIDEIGRFVRDEGILRANPLLKDNMTSQLLIILDGLDELSSQGQAAALTARNFVRSVIQAVERLNMQQLNVRVLFSGREVVVQESENELRQTRQVLTILPYYNQDRTHFSRGLYHDPSQLLELDLRNVWWKNYGELTGRDYPGLPEELARDDLNEVTGQPLLNYLLALSYCRGALDFRGTVNLNQIYNDLVSAVYERGYESGRKHESIRSIDLGSFFLILEEIGLAAWHGDGRTTTVSEIENYCRNGGFGEQLDAFQDGAKVGITSLLAAFFFRQYGTRPKGDPTFVFTHKSFGEYLAARRLVRAMFDICEEKTRSVSIGRSPGRGWSNTQCLVHWAEMCGPTALSVNIHTFLKYEIDLLPVDSALELQTCFTSLFNHLLIHGMPMEKITQVTDFQDALFQARNSEESLLAALNACALKTKKLVEIEHPEETVFGTWLRRIHKQRNGPKSGLILRCLSRLNLSHLSLDFADLYGADLSFSVLDYSRGYRICIGNSNAVGASFIGVHFESALASMSQMMGADFRDSNFSEADFSHSHLEESNFDNAIIYRTKMNGSSKEGASFIGAVRTRKEHEEHRKRLMSEERHRSKKLKI